MFEIARRRTHEVANPSSRVSFRAPNSGIFRRLCVNVAPILGPVPELGSEQALFVKKSERVRKPTQLAAGLSARVVAAYAASRISFDADFFQ